MADTGMHVVLYGNPVDGIKLFGPFKTGDEAVRWAGREIDDAWWIAPLSHPDDFSAEDDEDEGDLCPTCIDPRCDGCAPLDTPALDDSFHRCEMEA